LTERVELLAHQRSAIDASETGVFDDVAYLVTAPELEEHKSMEEEFESILVDFDFDLEDQADFDIYLKIKYFWNDWNPILTDIY